MVILNEVRNTTNCKECEYYGNRCYCPPKRECTAFKRKKFNYYSFEFKTDTDWYPAESGCWTDCPFSSLINWGESCKCLHGASKCPFTDERYKLFVEK